MDSKKSSIKKKRHIQSTIQKYVKLGRNFGAHSNTSHLKPFSAENQPQNKRSRLARDDEDSLTPLQRQLVEAYFATGSQVAAFSATDYGKNLKSNKTIDIARAARNKFMNKKIIEAIRRRQRELVDRYKITSERVLREYACLAFSDITDYYVVEGDNIRWKTREELTPEQRAAIKDISIFENVVTNTRKIAKMNLHSKKDALEALSKYLGLFEKHNMQLTQVNIAVDEIISGLPEGVAEAVRNRLSERIGSEAGSDFLDLSSDSDTERTIN